MFNRPQGAGERGALGSEFAQGLVSGGNYNLTLCDAKENEYCYAKDDPLSLIFVD